LLVNASGIPPAVRLTGGNRNDVTQLIPLIEDLHRRPVAAKVGRPRQTLDRLLAIVAMTTTSTAGYSGRWESSP
jgi:hypothetical protein